MSNYKFYVKGPCVSCRQYGPTTTQQVVVRKGQFIHECLRCGFKWDRRFGPLEEYVEVHPKHDRDFE